MQGVKYLIVITHKEFADAYFEIFKNNGVKNLSYGFCLGTATKNILNILGLQHKEKFMIQIMVTDQQLPKILDDLREITSYDNGDNGIAFTVPIDAIGGESSKRYFLGDAPIKKRGKKMENKESKCVLILTIVDRGYTEMVMEAARNAGAKGGTVVKAKGTGADIAKVLGMSISEEKEMVYILAEREKRNDIMYAIMDNAGADSPAHGIVFSLPVDYVLGVGSLAKIFEK